MNTPQVTVYIKDDFSPDSFSVCLAGRVFYAAPVVFSGGIFDSYMAHFTKLDML
jgi:hypothetical protein